MAGGEGGSNNYSYHTHLFDLYLNNKIKNIQSPLILKKV